MPQIAQILVLTFKIFEGGGHVPGPRRNFLFFFIGNCRLCKQASNRGRGGGGGQGRRCGQGRGRACPWMPLEKFYFISNCRLCKQATDTLGWRAASLALQGPYAPQGRMTLLQKLSVTSKVSARTSCAWVGSRVRFWSSEDVTLLEFTSPVDREYMRRCQKFHWI